MYGKADHHHEDDPAQLLQEKEMANLAGAASGDYSSNGGRGRIFHDRDVEGGMHMDGIDEKDSDGRYGTFFDEEIDQMTLKVRGLTYYSRSSTSCLNSCFGGGNPSRKLLKNINATLRPNQMVGLMGPSGAGKSTFLRVLTGRADGVIEGKLELNGQDLRGKWERMAMISKFLPAEDVLYQGFTPMQLLSYAACLRLRCSEAQRQRRIGLLIRELGLEKCKNTAITTSSHSLSTGERKRVMIALELLTNPNFLLLDEPCSGLDSRNAENTMTLLRDIARNKRTVVVSIHQPSISIFEKFDLVIWLNNGDMCFYGSPKKLRAYLKDKLSSPCGELENPATHFMQLMETKQQLKTKRGGGPEHSHSRVFSDIWKRTSPRIAAGTANDDLRHHPLNKPNSIMQQTWQSDGFAATLPQIDEDSAYTFKISFITQVWVLFKRRAKLQLIDLNRFAFNLSFYVMAAAFLGAIFWKLELTQDKLRDRESAVFSTITFTVWMSLNTSSPKLLLEKAVVAHEYHNGYYRLPAYYLAMLLCDTIFMSVYIVVFTSICWYMMGLNANWTEFYMINWMLALMSDQLGFTAGSLATSITSAMLIAPFVYVPCSILCGFFITPENIPLYFRWLHEISFIRFGWHMIMVSEFVGLEIEPCTYEDFRNGKCPLGPCNKQFDRPMSQLHHKFLSCKGEKLLEVLDMAPDMWETCLFRLSVLVIGLIILGYVACARVVVTRFGSGYFINCGCCR
mmetsp:Transcript_4329/g.6707  ORF Transcript_4329/g.6707 Transcript_4329/m.6707 type:complete len:736 (+) Transcript_4329:62-2269(+)